MQRKKCSAEIKAKIALEAVKGLRTLNEIAAESGVHSTQIQQWKKQLLNELPENFSSRGVPFGDSQSDRSLLKRLKN